MSTYLADLIKKIVRDEMHNERVQLTVTLSEMVRSELRDKLKPGPIIKVEKRVTCHDCVACGMRVNLDGPYFVQEDHYYHYACAHVHGLIKLKEPQEPEFDT